MNQRELGICMDNLSEREEEIRLWNQCLRGDREAWNTLVSNYSRPVCVTIRLQLRASSYRPIIDCEDINQEVFEKLLRKLYQWRREASLRTYIIKITLNVTIDHIRRIKPFHYRGALARPHKSEEENSRDIFETIADPIDTPNRLMSKILIEESQKFLTTNELYFLILRYREEWSFEEIAKHLNKNIVAIHTMHSRTLTKLRKIYEREEKQLDNPIEKRVNR